MPLAEQGAQEPVSGKHAQDLHESRRRSPKAAFLRVDHHSHRTQGLAASFMILTIMSSTSCATPSNCGVLNIASMAVGFKVARMVLPPSS